MQQLEWMITYILTLLAVICTGNTAVAIYFCTSSVLLVPLYTTNTRHLLRLRLRL